jgi:hypothetical protein
MRTLSVVIPDVEFAKLGFTSEQISYDELLKRIKQEIVREALEKTRSLADAAGISDMSMEEINAEIQAVRDAKTRH